MIKYPKIHQLNKIDAFLQKHEGDVVIQEKLDGSNCGLRYVDGDLRFQSRTTDIDPQNPGMFRKFVEWAYKKEAEGVFDIIKNGQYLLYGEMLGNGKIRYDHDHPFLLFDVLFSPSSFGQNPRYGKGFTFYPHLIQEFQKVYGIPTIPVLYTGYYQGFDHAKSFLGSHTFGERAEGVVVKAYDVQGWYTNAEQQEVVLFTEEMMGGKLVTEEYHETRAPKRSVREADDPFKVVAESVVTQARYDKAVQRMREKGKDRPKPHELIPIVAKDVMEEERELVKTLLLKAFGKEISRALAARVLEIANEAGGA